MERNSTFDIARAFSMLYIVGFWHLFGYSEMINRMPYGDYLKNATLATFVFISGYLLGYKYIIKSYKDLLYFFQRRIIRLIPLFALALFSYLIVGFISLKTSILSLTGLSTFIPPQPPTLWFVSMILVFYYFFAIMSGRKIIVQVLAAVMIFCIAFFADMYAINIDMRFFYYWPCFAIGVIFARVDLTRYLKSWSLLILTMMFFVGFSISHLCNFGSFPPWLYRLLISLSGVFLILGLSQIISGIHIFARTGSVVSYLSMAAYLFHRQIIDLIEKYVYWPDDGWIRVIYLIFICLPIVLIAGYLIQKIYDGFVDWIIHHFTGVRN